MKRTTSFLASALMIIAASCNDSGTADYNQDSSTNVRVDSGGGDTANYERMTNKTNSSADTTGGKNLSNSNDTANYERMPNKKVKDSTNY